MHLQLLADARWYGTDGYKECTIVIRSLLYIPVCIFMLVTDASGERRCSVAFTWQCAFHGLKMLSLTYCKLQAWFLTLLDLPACCCLEYACSPESVSAAPR